MASRTDSARAVTLALERLTGTVIVDGDVVDLPQREFRLLLELAARPGVPIHTQKLISALWPETSTMVPQDLYVVASRLRDRLGEAQRTHKLIVNQRARGYCLNLEPEQVLIADNLEEIEDEAPAISVEPESPSDQTVVTPAPQTISPARTSPTDSRPSPVRSRRLRPLAMGALVLVAIASSWSAGYLISNQLGSNEQATVPPPSDRATAAPQAGTDHHPREQRRVVRGERGDAKKKPRKAGSQEEPTAFAAAPAPAAPPPPSTQSGPGSQAPETQSPKQSKPSAPLPPAPTRFLYHLFNPSTGDHFVTTDGNVASQYHARGYEGGAVGRIYTSAVDGTRAISTNQGTAYVFVDAAPETEPSTRAVALWYSTNNAGDFFYSISEAEAKQQGWSARVVGYVGAL